MVRLGQLLWLPRWLGNHFEGCYGDGLLGGREPSSWVAGTSQAFEMRGTALPQQKRAAHVQVKSSCPKGTSGKTQASRQQATSTGTGQREGLDLEKGLLRQRLETGSLLSTK